MLGCAGWTSIPQQYPRPLHTEALCSHSCCAFSRDPVLKVLHQKETSKKMYLPPTYLVEGAVVWPRVFLGHPPWKIWGLWVFHEFKYECLISENKQKFQRVRRKLQKVKLTCARLKIYKTLYYISWSTQHRHTYTHIFNIYVIYITHTHTHLSIAVVSLLNCVWFFAMPWTLIHQTPPSMGFPRQEYWSG